jgi:hypothetical protein
MEIQTIEMDPNKVYSIIVEVGDMNVTQVYDYLSRVKSMYEEKGINAVYSIMQHGVPMLTINEIMPTDMTVFTIENDLL